MSQPMEILIRKGIDGADGATPDTTPDEAKEAAADKKDESGKLTQAALTAGVNFGKQALMAGIRNYGRITGDNRTARQIEGAINLAGYGLAIAVGGWIGLGVSVAQVGMKAYQKQVDIELANREAEHQRQRLGRIVGHGR